MRKILTVIFDFDGTLADTEKLYAQTFVNIVKEMNVNVPGDPFDFYCGKMCGLRWPEMMLFFKEAFPDVDTDEYEKRFFSYYNKLVEQFGIGKKPGADEIIDYLRSKNIKIGIASMSRRIRIIEKCRSAGIDINKIDVIFGGTDVKEAKPNPEVYLRCMEELGASPDETIIVEDSSVGAMAGINAGARVVVVRDLATVTEEVYEKSYRVFGKGCLIQLKTLL
jgi:HAD superfamily hydrolase (TIGR01509 family)